MNIQDLITSLEEGMEMVGQEGRVVFEILEEVKAPYDLPRVVFSSIKEDNERIQVVKIYIDRKDIVKR